MFIPGMTGQTRVQLACLATLYGTSVLYFIPSNPVSAVLVLFLNQWLQPFGLELKDPLWYSLIAQLFVCLAIVSLNVIWQLNDISPVPQASSGTSVSLRTVDFSQSLTRYCNALIAELDRYDRDVNWSNNELTPLEAEVETERNSYLRPRIVRDLVAAIRQNRKSEVFIRHYRK